MNLEAPATTLGAGLHDGQSQVVVTLLLAGVKSLAIVFNMFNIAHRTSARATLGT